MDINEFSISNGDVIAIPEEDAIYVNNGEFYVLGNRPFYYFKNGTSQKISLDGNSNSITLGNKVL